MAIMEDGNIFQRGYKANVFTRKEASRFAVYRKSARKNFGGKRWTYY